MKIRYAFRQASRYQASRPPRLKKLDVYSYKAFPMAQLMPQGLGKKIRTAIKNHNILEKIIWEKAPDPVVSRQSRVEVLRMMVAKAIR
jgi:hypothetical protein